MLGPLPCKQNVGRITATFCHLHLITNRKMKCEERVPPLHVTWFWKWSLLTEAPLPTSGRGLLRQSPNWLSCFYSGPHSFQSQPGHQRDPFTLWIRSHPCTLKTLQCPFSPTSLKVKADVSPMAVMSCMIKPQVSSPTSPTPTGLVVSPGKHQDWTAFELSPQGLPGHGTHQGIPVNISLLFQELLALSILYSFLTF